jgi:hypothetical protein
MAKQKQHVAIKAQFPFKGQVQASGYASQPPDTAVSCSNVMPFDPAGDRQRGGQRGGTTKLTAAALGAGTNRVNRLHQVQKADGTGTKCCATSGAGLYAGADFTSLALVNAAFVTALSNNTAPHSCDIFGTVYFVDGVLAAPKTYNPVAGTVGTLAASAGSLPGVATLCANFRGRLVLVVGQNLYFSRAGTPTDFDYAQRDVLAAVATGATSTFGRISQPVYALIPFSNDTMIVGCDHSILLVKGDPADGGVMLTISDSIGMLYKDGWCIDPAGNLYFLGTGGFFRIQAGGQTIENLSVGKMDAFFAQIPKSHNVQMAWDRDNKGCWIFATPYTYPGTTIGNVICYWDGRTEGFFPMDFPSSHGPESLCVFDGDTTTARYLVLGGRDGHIRKYDEAVRTDDGTAISSTVTFAPFRPGGNGQGMLTELEFYFGELPASPNFLVQFTVGVGKDAYAAFTAPTRTIAGTFISPGRQVPRKYRLAGGAFAMTLLCNTTGDGWTLEEIYARFEPAGRQR